VHRKYIQQDATLHTLFIYGNCSTCFGWYFHPSSGEHTTVSTASGIFHPVTAIWRYSGKVGTSLSELLVAYATNSSLKPVPIEYPTNTTNRCIYSTKYTGSYIPRCKFQSMKQLLSNRGNHRLIYTVNWKWYLNLKLIN
jgi:hypothetical protein